MAVKSQRKNLLLNIYFHLKNIVLLHERKQTLQNRKDKTVVCLQPLICKNLDSKQEIVIIFELNSHKCIKKTVL